MCLEVQGRQSQATLASAPPLSLVRADPQGGPTCTVAPSSQVSGLIFPEKGFVGELLAPRKARLQSPGTWGKQLLTHPPWNFNSPSLQSPTSPQAPRSQLEEGTVFPLAPGVGVLVTERSQRLPSHFRNETLGTSLSLKGVETPHPRYRAASGCKGSRGSWPNPKVQEPT